MPTFQQFDLYDRFSLTDYQKLPDSLRFDTNIKELGKLYRLLIGSVGITNNLTGESFIQNQNYSVLGRKTVKRFSKKLFIDSLSTGGSLISIDEYIKSSDPRNIPLYKDLINELCFFFSYSLAQVDTLAFLHVYRILERCSYMFPMLYASSATDYRGTFSKLQNYFKGSNSELKFFSLFIKDFFAEEFLNFRVRFNLTAHNEEIREKYYKILNSTCKNSDPEIMIVDKNEYTDITILNENTINLIVNLRNKYFHFLSGSQMNINSSDLIDPHHFFRLLNQHFINWLSIIFFEIIKKEIR